MRLTVPTRAPYRGPASKTVTFTAAGAGLQGAVTDVFTVTGEVIIVYLAPFCVTSLERDAPTPTLRLGSAPNSTLFISPTGATNIQAGKFWVSASTAYPGILLPDKCKEVILSADVICEVSETNNITAGVIRFDVYWLPLSPDGYLAAA